MSTPKRMVLWILSAPWLTITLCVLTFMDLKWLRDAHGPNYQTEVGSMLRGWFPTGRKENWATYRTEYAIYGDPVGGYWLGSHELAPGKEVGYLPVPVWSISSEGWMWPTRQVERVMLRGVYSGPPREEEHRLLRIAFEWDTQAGELPRLSGAEVDALLASGNITLAQQPLFLGYAQNGALILLILLIPVSVKVMLRAQRALREAERAARMHCPGCAYDLAGLTCEHCPECGADIPPRIIALRQTPP